MPGEAVRHRAMLTWPDARALAGERAVGGLPAACRAVGLLAV